MSPEATIEVVLRSSDARDSYHERRFTLGPNMKMPIGRASKNLSKQELMEAESNAYIDNPVVSRNHAVLSADHAPLTPSVYIIGDKKSMHGTTVNGTKLEPETPLKLSNGDVLQFGQDVTRNESFYVAPKFIFESSVPDAFPRGFSVPDGESSDEEEVDADEADGTHAEPPSRYGTQNNPVNIDDFEDAPPADLPEATEITIPEVIEIEDEDELAVRPEPTAVSAGTEERVASFSVEERVESEEAFNDQEERPPARFAVIDEASSDEGEDQSVYPSDGEDSLNESSIMSQAGDESDSDAEAPSYIEASDDNDEQLDGDENGDEDDDDDDENENKAQNETQNGGEDVDAGRRMRMMAMLNHENAHAALPDSPVAPRPSAPIAVPHLINSSAAPSAGRAELQTIFSTSAQSASNSLRAPEPAMQALDPYMNPLGMFEDSFGTHMFGHMDTPLPPRPAAPRPGPWSTSPYPNPFAREAHNPRLFAEDFPTNTLFMQSNTEFSSDMFRYQDPTGSETFDTKASSHQTQALVENPWTNPKPSPADEAPIPTPAAAIGVRTPPPAPFPEMSSPPQPRRTGVSIPEIVDSPQRPPTPASVTGSLKRKADVFEEDNLDSPSEATTSPAAEPRAEPAPTSSTTSMNIAAAPTPARPIKKLRSRLGSAAKSMAAYILPGTALTLALITQLPDSFYEN
ncbi:hypothetical protein K458DRAFT_419376 [Lentithecium fluviatile CBS 122367]|uniref:FHA domain-containing protein n=1 Tax=Lentithecium fluviatile CBS 122367 TaxID=1168545 RepID=A0A6G1IZ00_9PLEO|nr:hypothetical protein K458DRAFT_419376 [Lentithecium fluviatile CBS 122367]